ncbi:MAG: GNAT family N-acetyltransferase [Colwellia sp.]|nr:GNAT family N-acetyltransferase [Colwellia sp.]
MENTLTTEIKSRPYSSNDRESCMSIFDANCPKYFATNERSDYAQFLDSMPEEYDVFLSSGVIVGAFGLIGNDSEYKSINWILISPDSQGLGIGSIFMKRAISLANNAEIKHIKIAASHLSAPFFSKYGAVKVLEIKNGWGPDMHRIDMELMVSA